MYVLTTLCRTYICYTDILTSVRGLYLMILMNKHDNVTSRALAHSLKKLEVN